MGIVLSKLFDNQTIKNPLRSMQEQCNAINTKTKVKYQKSDT